MDSKKFITILILVLLAFTFFPGINKNEAASALNAKEYIAKQHIDGIVKEADISLLPLPFGGLASTYEGAWFITFWGATL